MLDVVAIIHFEFTYSFLRILIYNLSLANRYMFLNFLGNSEGCGDEQSVCGS